MIGTERLVNDHDVKAHVRRRVNSRSELSSSEQRQLVESGRVLLGAGDLEALLTWCDQEKLGWLHVSIEDEGATAYEMTDFCSRTTPRATSASRSLRPTSWMLKGRAGSGGPASERH